MVFVRSLGGACACGSFLSKFELHTVVGIKGTAAGLQLLSQAHTLRSRPSWWSGGQLASYEQIVQPEKFRAAIAVWRQEPQLWIDTEVADWSTPSPRLSLLQVRTATGPNVVVDVLEGSMRQVLHEEFIPQVMANDQVEKWAPMSRRMLKKEERRCSP
jgi:hypothetical protein